jgi:hypothetical protein
MKQIFTRTQAVSVLVQIKAKTQDIDIMAPVSAENKLFKLTNEELYSLLCKTIDADEIADVVDEPKFG